MSPGAACYARGTPPRPSPAPPTCSPGSAASSSPHDFPPYGRVRPHPDKSPTTPGPATPSPHNSETRDSHAERHLHGHLEQPRTTAPGRTSSPTPSHLRHAGTNQAERSGNDLTTRRRPPHHRSSGAYPL